MLNICTRRFILYVTVRCRKILQLVKHSFKNFIVFVFYKNHYTALQYAQPKSIKKMGNSTFIQSFPHILLSLDQRPPETLFLIIFLKLFPKYSFSSSSALTISDRSPPYQVLIASIPLPRLTVLRIER